MEKSPTTTFSIYLMTIFLLISTFITMVITESRIIDARERCPSGYQMDGNGKCQKIFGR